MGAGEKVPFFRFEWKRQSWNLAVAAGTIVGGFIASQFLSSTTVVALSIDTVEKLHALGFTRFLGDGLAITFFAILKLYICVEITLIIRCCIPLVFLPQIISLLKFKPLQIVV